MYPTAIIPTLLICNMDNKISQCRNIVLTFCPPVTLGAHARLSALYKVLTRIFIHWPAYADSMLKRLGFYVVFRATASILGLWITYTLSILFFISMTYVYVYVGLCFIYVCIYIFVFVFAMSNGFSAIKSHVNGAGIGPNFHEFLRTDERKHYVLITMFPFVCNKVLTVKLLCRFLWRVSNILQNLWNLLVPCNEIMK